MVDLKLYKYTVKDLGNLFLEGAITMTELLNELETRYKGPVCK